MRFATDFSVEVTPRLADKIEDFRTILRPGTLVYITFLEGSDVSDTIKVAERLRNEGFKPVPHFAARSIPNSVFLAGMLARLKERADLDQVLLIGGACKAPVGEFADTMQLLETGLFDKFGVKRIGVAGHPEGSPDIADEAIAKALAWKNAFAQRSDAEFYLVTQFCFEAAPIIAWDKRIQAEGNRLPIHIGIPGLATVKTLMTHAKACGVGPSIRFLIKQAANVTKLLTVSAPDRLVQDLAAYQASDPACGITKMHLFPLGGLKKSARWGYAVADGAFTLSPGGGFTVDADLS